MAARQLISRPIHHPGRRATRTEVLFALPIIALVTGLFYQWFALMDRYFIFLYFHQMGDGMDTTPFGWVTASRYWMSGLVAGGAVMLPYITLNLLLGRLRPGYRPPAGWRLWGMCALPLLVAIPAIVMTANDPVLPALNAAQVTLAALVGLALALSLGKLAAAHPWRYVGRLVDGAGLAILLVLLPSFEDYPRWLADGRSGYILAHLLISGGAMGYLLAVSAFYRWRRRPTPDPTSWLVAGLSITYLFIPLLHYLFFCTDSGSFTDPGYFHYIPDADNYFARSPLVQVAVWLGVALLAMGVARLRGWSLARRGPAA